MCVHVVQSVLYLITSNIHINKIIEEEETILEEAEEEEEGEDEEGDISSIGSQELVNTVLPASLYRERTARRKAVLKTTRRRSVCELNSIGDIPIPDSVAGMVLTRIDHMSATEQMVLKCASILGNSFTRTMLEAIVPNYSPTAFHSTLNVLAEAGIIECGVAAEARSMLSDLHTRSRHHLPLDDFHLHCPCLSVEHSEPHGSSHLPSSGAPLHAATSLHAQQHSHVDQCEMLQFVHVYVQETAYGLWTESQRISLHESAALYLESQAHKCTNCGGGGFLTGHKPAKKEKNQKTRASSARTAFSGNAHSKIRRMSAVTRRGSTASDFPSDQRRRASAAPSLSASTSQNDMLTEFRPPTAEGLASGVRYNSIGEAQVFGINLQDCQCDEILAHVYPQLVRHWRAARDMEKTAHYLIESASAAVATYNNMEALSLLHEAQQILEDYGSHLIAKAEHVKMESLRGQVHKESMSMVMWLLSLLRLYMHPCVHIHVRTCRHCCNVVK